MVDKEISLNEKQVKAWYKRFHSPGRYAVTKKGYVIDRTPIRIFAMVFLCIALFMFAGDFMRGEHVKAWAYCPPDSIGGGCTNELYGRCDLPACQKEFLLPGEEIGEPPDDNAMEFLGIMLMALGAVFAFNHSQQKTKRYIHARNSDNKQKPKRR